MQHLPVSYAVPGEVSSPKFANAFARGCKGHATNSPLLLEGPVALFGSPARWDLLQTAIADGRQFFYADHGYFRRGQYYRIAKNAYHGLGLGTYPPDRFLACHVDMAPTWRDSGTQVVICPNSTTYMRLFGIDARQWALDVATEVSKHSDRPLIIRWKAQAQARPLYHDLHDAHCVIVFSSGAAVEAVRSGIPVITLAPWAATRRMGGTELAQIESPPMPEGREQFIYNLAYEQYTLKEIADGMAWRRLREAA